MATQSALEVSNVLKAYVFVVRCRGLRHLSGAIATTHAEAEAEVRKRHNDWPYAEEREFFGCASAVMQPAKIERTGRNRLLEEEGFYAFLEGMFFVAYGSQRLVYRCAQRKMSGGWMAVIYSGNYYVIPKS